MFLARRLVREDEEQLKRFLEANLDTSMILRSNLELTGVQGQGRYSGDYFGRDRASFLADWRGDYNVEVLHIQDTQEMRREVRDSITQATAMDLWVLEVEGQPVSMTGFNAEAVRVVQVGGVWTPPPFRGRGYGRAVVAGSLLDRRAEGATRSVLFTDHDNLAALRAYKALGYRRAGEYGLWLFA